MVDPFVGDAADLEPLPPSTGDLWDRIVKGYAIPDIDGPLVEKWEQWYSQRPDYVARMIERSRRYLYHIVTEVEARGMPLETFLAMTGQSPEELISRLELDAQQSVARELVLEAVADQLELQVDDAEIEELIREQAELAEDDPDEAVKQVFDSGRQDLLRSDLRLRKALDRVAAEAKRIPPEVAAARDEIWTPDKDSPQTETKLWTPGSKEPA